MKKNEDKMKNRIRYFRRTFISILTAVISAVVLTFSLAGCGGLPEDEETVYTLHGSLIYEDILGNRIPVGSSRSAFPVIAADDYAVMITAHCTSSSKADVKTVVEGESTYSINLSTGTWKLTAIGYSDDMDSPEFVSKQTDLVTVTVDADHINPVIPVIKMVQNMKSTAAGSVALPIQVQSSTDINVCEATWKNKDDSDGSKKINFNGSNIAIFQIENIPAGVYTVTFNFYAEDSYNKILKYSCVESISVLSNLTTTLWYSPDAEYITSSADSDPVMYITEAIQKRFEQHTFFVDPSSSGNGDDSNNGTYETPFKTFMKAYDTWLNVKEKIPGVTWGIYIKSGNDNPYEESFDPNAEYMDFTGKITVAAYKDFPGDLNGKMIIKDYISNNNYLVIIEGSSRVFLKGIVFDGNNVGKSGCDSVIYNDSSAKTTFINCIVKNCKHIAVMNKGNLTLESCTIENNVASDSGAGIYNSTGANLITNNCTISTCQSSNNGGGLYNEGTADIIEGRFYNNSANGTSTNNGGGGAIYNTGTLFVTKTEFSSNNAVNGKGGAIYTASESQTTFHDVRIFESNSPNYAVYSDGYLNIAGAIITGSKGKTVSNGVYVASSIIVSGAMYIPDAIAFPNPVYIEGNITLAEGYSGAAVVLAPTIPTIGRPVLSAETEAILNANIPKFSLLNSNYGIIANSSKPNEGIIASVVYVSGRNALYLPEGNDSTGTGKADAPYATLEKAISVAETGTTLLVDGATDETNAIVVPEYTTYTVEGMSSDRSQNVIKRNSSMDTTKSLITLGEGCYLIFRDITVDGNKIKTSTDGAGIYANAAGSSLQLENTSVQNCSTKGPTSIKQTYGGGIYIGIDQESFSMDKNSVITGNSADNGGGLYIGNSMTLNKGSVESNTAKNGGGIYFAGTSNSLIIDGVRISGNEATASGGGIYCNTTGSLILNSGVIGDETATTQATESNCSNKAANGGGIYLFNGTLSRTDIGLKKGVTIAYNYASDTGGAVQTGISTTLNICFKEVKNNCAATNGNGVYTSSQDVTITHPTVFADTDELVATAGASYPIKMGSSSMAGAKIVVKPTDYDDFDSKLFDYKDSSLNRCSNARYITTTREDEGYYIATSGKLNKLDPLTEKKFIAYNSSAPEPGDRTVYVLDDQSELVTLKTWVNDGNSLAGNYFKLNSDIDATGTWAPIGYFESEYDNNYFSGTFDGNGKSIKNLQINSSIDNLTNRYFGLFGYVQDATIKNLTVGGGSLAGSNKVLVRGRTGPDYYYGGIVACGKNSTIENCVNRLEFSTGDAFNNTKAGGIVGALTGGEIKGCRNEGNIAACDAAGIAWATSEVDIHDCTNTGKIAGGGPGSGCCYAGIVCYVEGGNSLLYNCTNSGEVTYTESYYENLASCGGIVANFRGKEIFNCGNTGSINISTGALTQSSGVGLYVGGIVGYLEYAAINNCYNTGSVTPGKEKSDYAPHVVGGIIGLCFVDDGVCNALYNSGSVDGYGSSFIGEICGKCGEEERRSLKYCYWGNSGKNATSDDKMTLTSCEYKASYSEAASSLNTNWVSKNQSKQAYKQWKTDSVGFVE